MSVEVILNGLSKVKGFCKLVDEKLGLEYEVTYADDWGDGEELNHSVVVFDLESPKELQLIKELENIVNFSK